MATTPLPPTSNHPYTPVPDAIASIIYTETDEAPVSTKGSANRMYRLLCGLISQ